MHRVAAEAGVSGEGTLVGPAPAFSEAHAHACGGSTAWAGGRAWGEEAFSMDSEDVNYWVWNRLTRAQQLDLRSQPVGGTATSQRGGMP